MGKTIMTKYTSTSLAQSSVNTFFKNHIVVSLFEGAFTKVTNSLPTGLVSSIKAVNKRTLRSISMALVLSSIVSACSSGGGSGNTTTSNTVIPPSFSISSSHVTFTEDFATASTLATAIDVEGSTLTFSVIESTTGVVKVTTSTTDVRLSSIANANGKTTLTITLSDGTLSSTEQVVVQVDAVNDTPTLTISNSNLTLREDFAGASTLATASDVEGSTLTFSVTESTTGVVNVTTSSVGIRLSSIANVNGQTTLTISVSDGTLSSTEQVVVQVNAVNDPPILTVSNSNLTLIEDFAGASTLATASDVEGSTLTFSVTESTTGVVDVTTSNTGVRLSSIADANGRTTLTISVSDGTISSTGQVVVQVNAVNDPPTLTILNSNLMLIEDFAGASTLATAFDVEGSTLIFSVTESTTGVANVTTSNTGVRLSSIANAHGQTTLTISVSDGKLSSTGQVVVQVNAVNDPPTLTVSNSKLTLIEDFAGSNILASASDIEGSTLIFSVTESTTGVVNVTTSSAGVQVSSIADAHGRTTLTISVSDGTLSSTEQVVVQVNAVNDPPTLTVSNSKLTLTEDFTGINILATASDVEGNALTFSVTESTTGVVNVTASSAGARLSSIADANGRTTLTISVSDGTLSSTGQVVVQVNAANDPPTLTVSNTNLTLSEDFAGSNILATASDVDGNVLTFSVIESAPGVVTVTTSNTDVRVSSISNTNGRTTLTISVSDGTLSSTGQVVVQVNAVNDPPTLTLSNSKLILIEDFAGSSTLATAFDVEGNALTFSVTESTTGVVNVTTSSSGVRLSSIANANGRTTLNISVSDGMLSSTAQVVVTVVATEDVPRLIIPASNLTVAEDFLNIILVATAFDVDSHALTFSVTESTTDVVNVTTSSTGVRLSSIANANGRTTLTITISDGVLSSTAQVVVTVTAVEDALRLIIPTTTLTVTEDFLGYIMVARAFDVDGRALTFSVTESITGVVNITTSTTDVRLSSIANVNGRTTLTISLSGGTQSSTGQVVVQVRAVNDPPILNVSSAVSTLTEDFVGFSTLATAIDVEGDALSFSVIESTTGVVHVTTSTRGVRLSSIADANGRTTLTITVSDGTLSSTAQVMVIVTAVEDPLKLLIPAGTVIKIEDFGGISKVAFGLDVDGHALTFSVTESTTGVVNVVTSTRGVGVSSIANAYGRTTLNIRLSGGTRSTTGQVVVVVRAENDPPRLIIPATALKLTEDFVSASTIATAIDVEGSPLTLSVIESTTGVVKVTTSTTGVQLSSIAEANGRTTLTISVSDGTQGAAAQVVVQVKSVNDMPTLSVSSSVLMLTEDFRGAISLATASDVDGDTLTISVVESIRDVVNITTSASSVSISSLRNANGQTTLNIIVDDGDLILNAQVVIHVTAIDDRPTIDLTTNIISTNVGFSPIVIGTTASDVEDGALAFTLQQSSSGAVTVTTSANAIVLNAVARTTGTTTLTLTTVDNSGLKTTETIIVNVVNDAPVLGGLIKQFQTFEDFPLPIRIKITATDADNDTITLTYSSSTHLFNGTLSTFTEGASTLTLTSIANIHGTSTVTIRATDFIGQSTSAEIVVSVHSVIDPISFTLSTSVVTLSANSTQINRNVQNINILNIENQPIKTQWQVRSSGDPIFSADPKPVVSFTTHVLTTAKTLTSVMDTAQLYFSIAPGQSGVATLTVQLTNLTRSEIAQQTMVVQVNKVDIAPGISPARSRIRNLIVYGGHLYAYSALGQRTVNSFLITAKDLGGHLLNINTVEEFDFVRSTATGYTIHNAWFGLNLPQQSFPGALSWVTNDSTIVYGIASTSGANNLNVFPGHYVLNWDSGRGLETNRPSNPPHVAHWTVYSRNSESYFLLGDTGDLTHRFTIYEFPQGLPSYSNDPILVNSDSQATVRLIGFDLNGDAINTADWSGTDTNGGTISFSNVSQSTGVQTVNMFYTPPVNFGGFTTVAVTLQVNGLSTTEVISFKVNGRPNIVLSTYSMTVDEDFPSAVINVSVIDPGDGILPFTLQASTNGVVAITPSYNTIQISPIPHANGKVTLTIQATDSAFQSASTRVVITVQPVNDIPTMSIRRDSVVEEVNFSVFDIGVRVNDVEDGNLRFWVDDLPRGVVHVIIGVNTITLYSIPNALGRTTLTISATDSSNATVVRTITVNVVPNLQTPPELTVSTNRISVQEDFASVAFGYTATDIVDDVLRLAVRSSNRLVNAAISAQNIILSAINNLTGVATLTVRATDSDGLFTTTEVIVIVNAVNDEPKITVPVRTLSITSAPIVLPVSATDVEDGILAFSVSSGQGSVHPTATTSNLMISRVGVQLDPVVLTLTTTDSAGAVTTKSITVNPMPVLRLTTGIKTIDFAWSESTSATHYRLQSNPDGNSGFVDLNSTGVVISPNSTNIRQSTAQALVSLHRYIPRVSNPQFGVAACHTTNSCDPLNRYNTVTLTNAQLNRMIGRLQASNASQRDKFGNAVSLSGDGNTLVVAARAESNSSTGVNGIQKTIPSNISGAVYVFRRQGGVWSQQAYIKASNTWAYDSFGMSVSLSRDGNSLAVGASGEAGSSTGVNGNQTIINDDFSGAVYVFRFSSGTWFQQAYIKASNTDADDRFGMSVSLSSNGNTLAVGAIGEDSDSSGVNGAQNNNGSNTGAVYLFRFNAGVWSQQAFIKSSNPGTSDIYGGAVSLSDDGNTLAVGANYENGSSTIVNGPQNNGAQNAGAVYLFRFIGNVWSQQAYIKASNAELSDNFGYSVSLSADGNSLAVGAVGEASASTQVNRGADDNNAIVSGAAYVFRFSSSTWSQQAFIKPLNIGRVDQFGQSVSLSRDGNALVVGSWLEDGSVSGIDGADNNATDDAGAAYLFEFNNGTWSQQAYIKSRKPSFSANFGFAVSISGDGGTIAVGSPGYSINTGEVHLY